MIRLLPLAASLLPVVAVAQDGHGTLDRLPFVGAEAALDASGTRTLLPDGKAIRELAASPRASMRTRIVLEGGRELELELTRIPLRPNSLGFHVDGVRWEDALRGTDLSLWRGTSPMDEDASACLSFSRFGCRGWIQGGSELVHLIPQTGAESDWEHSSVTLVAERLLEGSAREPRCGTGSGLTPSLPAPPPGRDTTTSSTSSVPRECRIAVETDHELFQVLGSDLQAEAVYLATLLRTASDLYEAQINTVLEFPYIQLWSVPDPWQTQGAGGNCIDLLSEFGTAWSGNLPGEAHLGHFLSGALLGCGAAYLSAICQGPGSSFRFGVTGDVNGLVSFPVQQQPFNWDFFVFAHEVGHNFGSAHTHQYCPPLDECPPPPFTGACQTSVTCQTGTIMSYCYYCPGRSANIAPRFHPTVVDVIRGQAESCLPAWARIEGDLPDVQDPEAPLVLEARPVGAFVGAPSLHWRRAGEAFRTVEMSPVGEDLYAARIPALPCGEVVELYYSAEHIGLGTVFEPAGGQGSPHSLPVALEVDWISFDFEEDAGWWVEDMGVTSGTWERGVPIDDTTYPYDPRADHDGSGSAWLTGNQPGESDVDGGATILYSPPLDLSGPFLNLRWAFYLRSGEGDGQRFTVEISTAGSWIEVARYTNGNSPNWRPRAVGRTELLELGVILESDMVLRFTVLDVPPDSIVEGGLDAVSVTVPGCP